MAVAVERMWRVKHQRDAAAIYLAAMFLAGPGDVGWSELNNVVVARWPRGLVRVKTLAWKMRKQCAEVSGAPARRKGRA